MTAPHRNIVDISKKRDIENFNSETPSLEWTGSTDVSNIQVSTTHLEGKYSLSFDKDGTTTTSGTVSKTLGNRNYSSFARAWLTLTMNITSITNIASVKIILGADASNNNEYSFDPVAGWYDCIAKLDDPTTVNGTGCNWADVDYLAITVTFDSTSDTEAAMLFDNLSMYSDLSDFNTVNYNKYDSNSASHSGTNVDFKATHGGFTNLPVSTFVEITTDATITVRINLVTADPITITAAQSPYKITWSDYGMLISNLYITGTAGVTVFNTFSTKK